MLEKLLQHNNIGSKEQIIYVVNLLSSHYCSIRNLKQACVSKEYSFANSFDGIICLLQWLNIIKIDNLVAKLNKKIKQKEFTKTFCGLIFLKLSKEKELHHFLNNNNLDFKKSIYVKNSLISLKFSPLRNFLISVGLFEKDNLVHNQFIINKNFSEWFIENIVTLIDKSRVNSNPLSKLESTKDRQKELGKEAEKFVLNYERIKRSGNPKSHNIQIISEFDTNAGYDIVSYINDQSIFLDKFIEVKSYSKNPCFYWSRNEVKVAEQEQDNYFLYIVNSNRIHENGYEPQIIQNPYDNVFNKYDKKCQSWKFELLNQI